MIESMMANFWLSVFAGYFVNASGALAGGGWRRMIRQLESARSAKQLPASHHIQRGTARANLLATQMCIQQLIDSGQEAFLDDISHTASLNGVVVQRDEYYRDPRCNIAARSSLQKKLHELIIALEPQDTPNTGRRDQKRFENALLDATLPISGTSLDRYGGEVFSTLDGITANSAQTPKSPSIREVRHEVLPGLEDAVIQQILCFGNWPDARHEAVATGIRAAFFGEDELWIKNFALCYVAELRQDTNLYRMAVFLRLENFEDALATIETGSEALQHEVDALAQDARRGFDEISLQVHNLYERSETAALVAEDVLNHLRKLMAFNGQEVFHLPSIEKQEQLSSAFVPFYFAEEEDAFTGREDILEQLHDKLLKLHDEVPKFRWAAICGNAGTGKSRLAFHIIKTYSATWRLSGFVRKEFIKTVELTLDSLSGITGPTLFVIDYAGSIPEACCRFIERCALLAEDAPFPVRMIVLLRRANDRFFEFIREKEDGAIAINTQVRFTPPEGYDTRSGALFLTALKEEETLKLMRNRIKRTAKSSGSKSEPISMHDESDENLLSLLRKYDSEMRPLFTLMVADSLQKGLLKDRSVKTNQEEARLALFWDYLEHQFDKRWKKALGKSGASLNDKDRDRIDRHITFLILSTMCRGLMDDGWQQLVYEPKLSAVAKAILPHSQFIFEDNYGEASTLLDENLLTEFSGTRRADLDRDFYPILEPDLIGEALVLLIFEQRGKYLSLQTGTAQRRCKYLRDFAWEADPEGSAFFSVLIAQDYPEHAAKLRWLLPDEQRMDGTTLRVKLFRNLVPAIIEPFRYRAATQDDVDQIKKLIETFQPKPSVPDEVLLEYLIGLGDLAEQLSFMVNKTVPPKGVNQIPIFSDKLGRRRVAFGRAAAKDADGVEVPGITDIEQHEDEAIYQFRSDTKAINAALSLLRLLYDEAIGPAFSANDLEIRHQFSIMVGFALSSVFWKFRNEENKFGFASSPPSEEENAERERIAELCNSALISPDLNEDTLAVVCHILYVLIYAEHGENKLRGRKAFEAIYENASSEYFTKETSIKVVLNFIGNHAYNEIEIECNKQVQSEQKDLSILGDTVEKLMHIAIKLPSLTEHGRDSIARAFLQVCSRLARYNEQRNVDSKLYLDRNFTLYNEFIDRHGVVSIGTVALDFISDFLKAFNHPEQDADNALTGYSELVAHSRFDRQSLNKQSWINLRYHFVQLASLPSKDLVTTQSIVQKMIEQIGSRANRDLIDMLLSQLPNPAFNPELVDTLAELGRNCSEDIVDAEKRDSLNLAIMSQHLLRGDNNSGFKDLEELWTLGNREEDFVARTEVFNYLQMLIWWHGLEHSKIKEWRQRLLNFINHSEPSHEEILNSIQRSHDKAAIATAETFARLEITAGLAPDDWLLLKETD
jgi:hypothetical protein